QIADESSTGQAIAGNAWLELDTCASSPSPSRLRSRRHSHLARRGGTDRSSNLRKCDVENANAAALPACGEQAEGRSPARMDDRARHETARQTSVRSNVCSRD